MRSSNEASSSWRLPDVLLSGAAVVGLVLLVLGFFWSRAVPSRAFWNQEQAEEYTDAAVTLHELSHAAKGTPEEQQRQMDAARQRFKQAQADLESARFARNEGGRYISLVGSIVLGGSALGLYFRRQNSPSSAA
jgi:hypothetical protein